MNESVTPVLTISIAAYNVGAYLKEGLDSLKGVEGLEVLIINDGSTDDTARVAGAFVESDPDVFRLINKENGGYGSTVNRGVEESRGKYFKILDGDDWFDKSALQGLVDAMRVSDADLFFMPRAAHIAGGGVGISDFSSVAEGVLDLRSEESVAGHWNIAVRTDKIKGALRPLPEHCLYTDMYFVLQCLAIGVTNKYYDRPVYCYRIGREGQSVSVENRIKHVDDLEKVIWLCTEFFEEKYPDLPDSNIAFFERRAFVYYLNLFRTVLLGKASFSNRRRLISSDKKLANLSPRLYRLSAESKRIRLGRAFGYMGYWVASCLSNKNWG